MAHVMHPRGSMSIELNGLLKASQHLFCLVPGATIEPVIFPSFFDPQKLPKIIVILTS
jgi:hypothetical protein